MAPVDSLNGGSEEKNLLGALAIGRHNTILGLAFFRL